MRLILLALAVVLAGAACSGVAASPILSDAEKCVRFGGFWMGDWCRVDGR